jgi:hypothetical protein
MNIGKEIEIRQVPERRIAVPEWPKVKPAERPIEAPNWPVKQPVKVPEKVGVDVRI